MKIVQNIPPEAVLESKIPTRFWRWAVSISAAAIDFLVVYLLVVSVSILYHKITIGYRGNSQVMHDLALMLSLIFVFSNLLQRRYRIVRYLSKKGQIEEAFNTWNVTMVAFLSVGFMTGHIEIYSRAVVILSYSAGILVVPLFRYLVVRTVSRASKTGRIASQRVLLIGEESEVVSFMMRHQPWNSGIIIQEMMILEEPPAGSPPEAREELLKSDIAYSVARARETKPDSVIIVVPWSARRTIERCVESFMTVPIAIHLAPEEVMDRFENPRISRLGTISSLELTPPPMTSPELIAKRLLDFFGALFLSIILSPFFLVTALLIKLDSKGPVLFFQRRYGFNQEPFHIIKFRTMTTLDDGEVVKQATRHDPRITRVGRWLRRLNIDELPQLANVLQGRMSLVGPRPHALAHNHEFEDKIALYARRHNVKPGITGWAQVNGLRGETDTEEKMSRRVAHDLWYIDNWSIWLDIVILFRTIFSRKSYRNAF